MPNRPCFEVKDCIALLSLESSKLQSGQPFHESIGPEAGTAVAAWDPTAVQQPARELGLGRKRTSIRWLRRMRRMQESGLSGGTPLSSGAGRFIDPCRHRPPPAVLNCAPTCTSAHDYAITLSGTALGLSDRAQGEVLARLRALLQNHRFRQLTS